MVVKYSTLGGTIRFFKFVTVKNQGLVPDLAKAWIRIGIDHILVSNIFAVPYLLILFVFDYLGGRGGGRA